MSLLIGALHALVFLFELSLLAPLLYLLVLSAGALLQLRRQTIVPSRAWAEFYDALPVFAVLVDDRGSPWDVHTTLESIARLDYPEHRYATIVVTDAGGDALSDLARDAGVRLYESGGTGDRDGASALNAALNELIVTDERFDAYVVVRSGSQLSTAFLRHMASALANGAQVAQARMCPAGSGEGWRIAVGVVISALFDYLRPLGRAYFGWSAGCRSDGVCFTNDVAQLFGWGGGQGDDAERTFQLVQSGIAVAYLDGAMVFTDQPTSARPSLQEWMRTLRDRWSVLTSRRGMMRGRQRRDYRLLRLDAALELVLPPLPILAALLALGIVISWTLAWIPGVIVALVGTLALAAHLAAGAALADLSWREYLLLAQAPVAQARLWLQRVALYWAATQSAPRGHANLVAFRRASPASHPLGTAPATEVDTRQSKAPADPGMGSDYRMETGAWQAMGVPVKMEARTRSRVRGA
jgi:hypothetical protein